MWVLAVKMFAFQFPLFEKDVDGIFCTVKKRQRKEGGRKVIVMRSRMQGRSHINNSSPLLQRSLGLIMSTFANIFESHF